MHIGLINEYFPPFAPGGAEWSTLQLGRALVERGHTVTVITPNYGAKPYEVLDGLQVRRFPYLARLKGRRTLSLRWLASPGFYLWSAIYIWAYGRQTQLDILHVQNKYVLPGAWLAGKWLRRPVVTTLRDTLLICPFGRCMMRYEQLPANCGHGQLLSLCRSEHMTQYIRPRTVPSRLKAHLVIRYLRWDAALRRWFLRHVNGIITVSENLLALHQQAGVRLGGQTTVIYNLPPQTASVAMISATELRHRFQLGEGPLVLYIGKFSPGKGTADLVKAATRVIQEVPQVQFAFVGDTHLNSQIDPVHLHVLGRLPNTDVLQLYRIADLVVVPSVWPEPFSRVVLEAMAMGRAVIGTRVGGTPELIEDGYNGCLVPRSSPDKLAQTICTLLRDPARRRRMGEAGRRLAEERFSANRTIDRLLSFYHGSGAKS